MIWQYGYVLTCKNSCTNSVEFEFELELELEFVYYYGFEIRAWDMGQEGSRTE